MYKFGEKLCNKTKYLCVEAFYLYVNKSVGGQMEKKFADLVPPTHTHTHTFCRHQSEFGKSTAIDRG